MLTATKEELDRARRDAPDSFIDIPVENHPNGKVPLTVICRANTEEDFRSRHVDINIKRKIPRFMDRSDLRGARFQPIAIVGGGPSLKRHLNDIRRFRYVMAAGSSHDFLVENGIIPTFAVSTDSREETVNYYQKPQTACSYLLASSCSPTVFDALADYPVYLWHFREQCDAKHFLGEQEIGWGCMVGVVCIQMALWLGFQEHHYFGYDCSLEDNESHAYPLSEWEKKEIAEAVTIATCGEEKKEFATTTALLCQMTHFYGVYRSPDAQFLKGYVYGGGLLHDNIRQSPPEMRQWLEAV